MLAKSHARIRLVTAVFLGGFASAAEAQGTAQQRSDCMGDAFKFCSAYIPNVSRIEACLQQNVSRLTPACAAEFKPNNSTSSISVSLGCLLRSALSLMSRGSYAIL